MNEGQLEEIKYYTETREREIERKVKYKREMKRWFDDVFNNNNLWTIWQHRIIEREERRYNAIEQHNKGERLTI